MATTKTFTLHDFGEPVEVALTPNVTEEQLLTWPAFMTWKSTLQANLRLQYTDPKHDFKDDPYVLQSITVQSVDWFGPKIGFTKLKAIIRNSTGKELPGVAFLRGGSVAMLMILRPIDSRDERWVVLTEQPRVPAGSLRFVEIPAGMIEDSPNFYGAAAKEIKEETGFTLPRSELIDLTQLALQKYQKSEPTLKDAMYPSPGGSDEFMPIFLWEKELDRQEIEDLRGKLTGERQQGEMIKLSVVRYESLWKLGARDAKTLAAWALYEGLNREGAIKEEIDRRKKEQNAPARGEGDSHDDDDDEEAGAKRQRAI